MPPPKLVIFDGGGTIWYSMDVLWAHARLAFSSHGLCRPDEFPFPLEAYNEITSLRTYNSRRAAIRGLLALYYQKRSVDDVLGSDDPEGGLKKLVALSSAQHPDFCDLSADLGKFVDSALDNHPDDKYPLCPFVRECLDELKSHQCKVAMSSNRKESSVIRILEAHGIRQWFDAIDAPERTDGRTSKPVDVILGRLGVERSDAVFVGDSILDIVAGKEAGVFSVGVLSGAGTQRSLIQFDPAHRPDCIIDDLSQLWTAIERRMSQ